MISTPMKPRKRTQPNVENALPSLPVLVGFAIFCLSTAFVIFGLTAFTFNLDDIKIPGLYIGGALSLLAWAILWARGEVPSPPRVVWIPYVAFLVVCLLSTVFAAPYARWMGWEFLGFYVSCFGLVLLGSGVITNRRMVELSLKFWVLIAFSTTTFGLVHYAGLLEPIYNTLYPTPPTQVNRVHDLIYTFMRNRSMLSTILNVQFFGVFLLMVLPVCAATLVIVFQNMRARMLRGESLLMPLVWMTICGLSIVFSITCVFTTFSKSALIFLPVAIVGFLGGLFLITRVRQIPHLGAMSILGVIMAGTILFFTMGDLRRNFLNVDDSLGPRNVIYSGALAIFKDNPILGSGPGSFRIVFPVYRSPDYHMVRISNVTLYAHNWVLDLLAETGLGGALTYIAFLGGIFWLAILTMRRSDDVAFRVAALGCAVGIVCVHGGALMNPMSRWPVGMGSIHAMLGTMLGIVAYSLRALNEGAGSKTVTQPVAKPMQPVRLAVAVGSGVFLLLIGNMAIRNFQASVYHNEAMRRSELNPNLFDSQGNVREQALPTVRQAVDFYERSLALRPGSPTTYYKLAHVYNQLGDPEKALDTYRRLQDFSPDYSEVHYNLAVIYYTLANGRRSRANQFLQMAQNPDQASPEVVDPMGEYERLLAESIGLFEKSIASFERAAEMSNKISVHFFKGATVNLYAQVLPPGSPEARAAFRKAADIYVRTSELPLTQAVQQAGQRTREMEQRHSSMSMARDAYRQAGETELAAIQAERYFRRNPHSRQDLELAANLYLQADRLDDSIRLVDEALAMNPLNPEVQVLKWTLYTNAEKVEQAARQARFVLALDDRMKESGQSFLAEASRASLESALATAADG